MFTPAGWSQIKYYEIAPPVVTNLFSCLMFYIESGGLVGQFKSKYNIMSASLVISSLLNSPGL